MRNLNSYEHNQEWTIGSTANLSEIDKQIASRHESAHSALDTTTVYGQLIYAYKNFIPSSPQDEQYFKNIAEFLHQNSKIVQEVNATWSGLAMVDHSHEAVSNLNSEYMDYYRMGAHIVEKIPSEFLAEVILNIICTFCLQGKRIGDYALEKFGELPLNMIDAKQYPDNRFFVIVRTFGPDRYRSELQKCIENMSHKMAELCNQAIENKLDIFHLKNDDKLRLLNPIVNHFYSFLDEHFKALGSESFGVNETPDYVKLLYKDAHFLDGSDIDLHTDLYDIDNAMLRLFEGEELIYNELPLEAELFYSNCFTADLRDRLLTNNAFGEESLLVLNCSHSVHVLESYHFVKEEHRNWISEQDRVLLYILMNVTIAERKVIFFVPFANAEDLDSFLVDSQVKLRLVARVYQHCVTFPEFGQLTELLDCRCSILSYICDVSPVLLIKHRFFIDGTSIEYADLDQDMGDSKQYAGLILKIIYEEVPVLMLLPPGEIHAAYLSRIMYQQRETYKYKSYHEMLTSEEMVVINFSLFYLKQTQSFKFIVT